jgi:hypothetical protein
MRNAGLWAFALGCHNAYPLLRARIEIRIRSATTETHTAMPALAVLLTSITLSSTSLSRGACREVSKLGMHHHPSHKASVQIGAGVIIALGLALAVRFIIYLLTRVDRAG